MEQVEGNINPTRELAAIMFSDVVGYTAIMGRDEQKGVQAIADHRAQLRSLLPRFNGRLIGEIGDGTLTSFHSVLDAIGCARELQANLKDDRELRLRIGIHLGDVLLTNNTVLGDGVNVASRIHALAPPGGICVSEHVYDEIRNKPGMVARNLGKKNLKNVSRPIRVYSLASTATEAKSQPTSRRRLVTMAAIAAVALVIVVAYASRARIPTAFRPAPVAAGKVTIAVLPFVNLSNDKQDEYFSDGMTDEIIGNLSKITNMQVAARTSSFAFKGQNQDASKIASLLHVRNLLEGSVRRIAGKVRIEVELIDAVSGFSIWSERYDKEIADVFAIQSDVAESVAETLKVKLLPNEKTRVEHKPTENLEAYDLYLQGRYYLYSQFSEEGFTKAIDYFNRAIEKDPNFALAYSELGQAYGEASVFTQPPRDAIPKAKAFIQRALAIDDTLADAHNAMANNVLFGYDWDWPGAEREFKRALELDPSDAQVHNDYGVFLMNMGRFDEAIKERQRSHELNPLQVQSLIELGIVYTSARQYDRALGYLQQAISIAPDNWWAYQVRGLTRLLQKDWAAAATDLEKADSLSPSPLTKPYLALVYGQMGRRDKALQVLDQLNEMSTHQYVDPSVFAGVYFGLGDLDQGFRQLDRAYEARSFWLVTLKQPQWDGVRSDPRFVAMYKKVGLPP